MFVKVRMEILHVIGKHARNIYFIQKLWNFNLSYSCLSRIQSSVDKIKNSKESIKDTDTIDTILSVKSNEKKIYDMFLKFMPKSNQNMNIIRGGMLSQTYNQDLFENFVDKVESQMQGKQVL